MLKMLGTAALEPWSPPFGALHGASRGRRAGRWHKRLAGPGLCAVPTAFCLEEPSQVAASACKEGRAGWPSWVPRRERMQVR